MKHKIDPTQKVLFDMERGRFSRIAARRIQEGWQGIFRSTLLALMPAEEMGRAFDSEMGRRTKELYAMAGLVVIAGLQGWTSEEAADAYMFDLSVQYALNVGHDQVELSARSVERYQRLFREQELAIKAFERVTQELVRNLELAVDKQRLDSTHLFSNMARFSRTQLLGVCIRRFLVSLRRHHNPEFAALDRELVQRYARSEKRLFGPVPKAAHQALREQTAKDLLTLIERFATHKQIAARSTYKNMVRVFEEQCEVVDEKIVIRKTCGGRVMQNPSDPDATYDGHKGPGYQVQLSETCNPKNPVQLITSAIPQTAAEEDGDALKPVVETLDKQGFKPTKLLADTLYGSDENQQYCEQEGIDLIAPVRGPEPKTEAITEKQKRLAQRRAYQQTESWKEEYRARSGLEGTNSCLKRRLDLGRLRVRGRRSVFQVVLLKITGWNILRAAAALRKQTSRPRKAASNPLPGLFSWLECAQWPPIARFLPPIGWLRPDKFHSSNRCCA